jgi:hypothetical protein
MIEGVLDSLPPGTPRAEAGWVTPRWPLGPRGSRNACSQGDFEGRDGPVARRGGGCSEPKCSQPALPELRVCGRGSPQGRRIPRGSTAPASDPSSGGSSRRTSPSRHAWYLASQADMSPGSSLTRHTSASRVATQWWLACHGPRERHLVCSTGGGDTSSANQVSLSGPAGSSLSGSRRAAWCAYCLTA